MYEEKLGGPVSEVDFSKLEAAAREGHPEKFRNEDWMVLGPFVMETGGAFETEYLYKRDLILEPDYLIHNGGERGVTPYLGLTCQSDWLGGEKHVWSKGHIKWDCLRFDPDDSDSACDEALYLTEQRNCIFYAAFYVRCESEKRAVICYETSGSRLFLNGELISDEPYGRVKGVSTMGRAVPVTFRAGRNLLLFKVRPGYICDTVDMSISNCAIWPAAACSGALGVTYPSRTAVFARRDGEPVEIFPCWAAAYGDTAGGVVTVNGRD
ncbi:MAG: hypothetical protein IJL69_06535, partial [Oscillospiraceae bacterium]|nr:hypothetical protein [Oscillospiraceae bacterium]